MYHRRGYNARLANWKFRKSAPGNTHIVMKIDAVRKNGRYFPRALVRNYMRNFIGIWVCGALRILYNAIRCQWGIFQNMPADTMPRRYAQVPASEYCGHFLSTQLPFLYARRNRKGENNPPEVKHYHVTSDSISASVSFLKTTTGETPTSQPSEHHQVPPMEEIFPDGSGGSNLTAVRAMSPMLTMRYWCH